MSTILGNIVLLTNQRPVPRNKILIISFLEGHVQFQRSTTPPIQHSIGWTLKSSVPLSIVRKEGQLAVKQPSGPSEIDYWSYVFLEFVTLKHSRDIDITCFLFGQTLTTYRDLGIGRLSSSWLLLLDWVIRSESGPAHKTCHYTKAQSAETDWASLEISNTRILLGNGGQNETYYYSARTRSIPRERYRGPNV